MTSVSAEFDGILNEKSVRKRWDGLIGGIADYRRN